MTVTDAAVSAYLLIQAHRARELAAALTLLERDLDKGETQHGVTHEVVQRALRHAEEDAESLQTEADMIARYGGIS